ncbi:nucleotidyltransferase family protein [Nitrospinae bacterium AH_259_B05_G02_I21]|nr:nucleotidyltransferase family protein [Nitrospinae bacterium AH_259_B05_G02_I21]MDA2931706.1 nucleotidyltransferase family protein [Nitrospinae bacterium AH-259-F20]
MEADLVHQTQELLQTSLRWSNILQVASQHGVASLLYKNLKKVDAGRAIPDEASRKLLQLYNRTALLNHLLFKSLGELLESFTRAGIKVIVLKGPYLAQLIYTDFASRPFRDLDLLIQKEDLEKARQMLVEAGYTLMPGLLADGFFQQHHFSLPFLKEDGVAKTYLELHWNLADQFMGCTLDMEDLWARAHPAVLSDHHASALSPEDLITHLSLHLDMHGYLNRVIIGRGDEPRFIFNPLSENRLIWFTDILEVIDRYRSGVDWAALVERSKQTGTAGSVATSLTLLNLLFGPVVDRKILKELDLPRTSLVRRSLLRWFLTDFEKSGEHYSMFLSFLQSKLLETRKGVQFRLIRLVSLWEYIFPSYDFVKRRYNIASKGTVGFFYVLYVLAAIAHCVSISLHIVYYFLKKKLGKPVPRPS